MGNTSVTSTPVIGIGVILCFLIRLKPLYRSSSTLYLASIEWFEPNGRGIKEEGDNIG